MSDDLLTSRQVAGLTGKTITTVNRWVSEGRLEPALQVPGYRGARLFDLASVEAIAKGSSNDQSSD